MITSHPLAPKQQPLIFTHMRTIMRSGQIYNRRINNASQLPTIYDAHKKYTEHRRFDDNIWDADSSCRVGLTIRNFCDLWPCNPGSVARRPSFSAAARATNVFIAMHSLLLNTRRPARRRAPVRHVALTCLHWSHRYLVNPSHSAVCLLVSRARAPFSAAWWQSADRLTGWQADWVYRHLVSAGVSCRSCNIAPQ